MKKFCINGDTMVSCLLILLNISPWEQEDLQKYLHQEKLCLRSG